MEALTITGPQRRFAADALETNDNWDPWNGGSLIEASLHVATADEMSEPSNYGREGVAQNDPAIRYPVAAFVTISREFGSPPEEMVKRVARKVEDGMDPHWFEAVSKEAGHSKWSGDVDPLASHALSEGIERVARQLLENANAGEPMDHECVTLLDARGTLLASWERQ